MAVNIFEQLVRAALNADGYLTLENAAYRLHDDDQAVPHPGDIDLIAFHPRRNGLDRVLAVNCKSGKEPLQVERDVQRIIERSSETVSGSPAKSGFRELNDSDWAKAFRRCIGDVVGGKAAFTHVTVVRGIEGDRRLWTENESFRRILKNPLQLWDVNDILQRINRAGHLHGGSNALKLVALFQRAA